MTTKTAQQPPRHKVTPISAAIKNGQETASPLPKPRNKITYTPAPLPAEGVVRLPSIIAVLGISKTSFLDGVKAGKFPPGKLLTPRCRVWPVEDIRALIEKLGGAA